MPENDLLRRSLDAGVAFTQLTRKRAESIVREWVRNGEVNREQATARVEELLERSRQNTDALLAVVRKEIDDRVAALNLVTREDLAHLASRLGLPMRGAKAATPRSSATKSAASKSTAKKATATKSPAEKTAAKKAAAKRTAPQKSSAAKKSASVVGTRATSARSGSVPKAAKSPASKAGAPSKKAPAGPSSSPRG